jgi:serine/threonine protein kinase
MAHLHQRGIMHGDLYAHNTLVHASLPPLLSDFGAASRYVPDGPHAGWLQALDVCAFGYLLGELLAACPQAASRPGLAALADTCTQADSHLRPSFGQIVAQLSTHGAALQA